MVTVVIFNYLMNTLYVFFQQTVSFELGFTFVKFKIKWLAIFFV